MAKCIITNGMTKAIFQFPDMAVESTFSHPQRLSVGSAIDSLANTKNAGNTYLSLPAMKAENEEYRYR